MISATLNELNSVLEDRMRCETFESFLREEELSSAKLARSCWLAVSFCFFSYVALQLPLAVFVRELIRGLPTTKFCADIIRGIMFLKRQMFFLIVLRHFFAYMNRAWSRRGNPQ